uniref:AMP-activated protein kinase glycogen-binding domain-containing protein n=1 Tax=Vitis vinifera TaxID=29760 RepID=F6HSK3_VITVI
MNSLILQSSLQPALGCPENQVSWFSWKSTNLDWEDVRGLRCNVTRWNLRVGSQKCAITCQAFVGKQSMHQKLWRTYSMPINLDKESSSPFSQDYSSDNENASEDSPEELLDQPLGSDELKTLLVDSERTKLIKKLSEANQQNRILKRQLYIKEDALVNFKSELAVMELEVQALVSLAEEIAKSGIPKGSRKINGKYIQSHLHSRLEAVHEKLKEQIKDVDAVQSKEVSIIWCGMAESVQVMGTFDGWSQGEHLSPEYTGSFTKFSTTLMLRPGRYEIKFLVDGEWQLSPEFPTVGEGLMENNLLIVK